MTTREYLEVSETEALENEAPCLRDRLLIRLPRRLGIRITEVLNLTVEDIDFNAGELTIEHLKARIKLSCPKCGARLGKNHKFCPQCSEKVEDAVKEEKEHLRLRTLPVDGETLALLKTYIEKGGPSKSNGKRRLFTITRQRAWQIYLECAGRAGLPELRNPETGRIHHVSPHKLRDAFAVAAVKYDDSGDGLRLLQEQLGHSNITTTMKYRKVARTEQREWYDKLSEGMK